MNISGILTSVALGVCLSTVHAQPTTTYDALIQRGEAQLVAKDSAGALATGQQAIQLDANRWEAYALAGGALMKLKRYDEAIDDLSKSIDHAPVDKQAGLRDLIKQCVLAETGAPATPAEPVAAAPAQPTTTSQAEIVLWKSIENSPNPADFRSYLEQYPNGAFTVLAKRHLTDAIAQQEQAAQQMALELESATWKDPATGLMWTKQDSGKDLNWHQAAGYCQSMRLGGYQDWRLPTIDELQGIYDAHAGGHHVKGSLQLSNWWVWSSSPGNASGSENFNFNFNNGRLRPAPLGNRSYECALCVRRSGK